MIRRLPIRVRVAAALAVAMALVLAGSGFFLYLRLGAHLATALDNELRVRAQDLADVAARSGPLPAGRIVERGESYAQVLGPGGTVLRATAPLGRRPLLRPAQLAQARRGPIFLDEPAVPGLDERSRLLAMPVGGRVLVVGATLQDRAETLASFRDELLVAGPIALVLAVAAGYGLVGVALRPVEAMRRRAAAISAVTAGERLPVPATGDELERLAETLNAMLGRLEGAFERERDFVADAGHELRTPLALLKTELELALRQAQSREELRAAVRRSSEEAERLSQLAEDLLLFARADRGRLPLRIEELPVDALLAAVASRFEWRAREARKAIRVRPANGLGLRGDRVRLEQALANLVDNGLRHGGTTVELAAEQADGQVELHVLDDGPGFADGFLERAFERFSRADPARSAGGSGLGLAIVRTIAEAHGGLAAAANRPQGGADVWIALRR